MEIIRSAETIFNTFGAPIAIPIILFVLALSFGVKPSKAFLSALLVGVGLKGFLMIINAYIPLMSEAVQSMVAGTGVDLPILDVGWETTSIAVYSTSSVMIFIVVGLGFQLLLYVAGWTDIFQPTDLWNNYQYMAWGALIFVLSGSFLFALLGMLVLNLYSLLFSEMVAQRWSRYYGYPRCTIMQIVNVGIVPYAVVMDWVLEKLGANKVNITPKKLEEKLGFLGKPIVLGLLVGLVIGILANIGKLNQLSSWGNMLLVGVSTSAVMTIFPKIAEVFAQAFTPLAEVMKEKAFGAELPAGEEPGHSGDRQEQTTHRRRARDLYLGINDAAGYGEPATLICGIILVPIVFLLALVLPGNKFLPLVDLIALPFLVQGMVPIMNGNIFKVTIAGTLWFGLGLYVATWVAPAFTEVVSQAGINLPEDAVRVSSLAIYAKPIIGALSYAFMRGSWILIGIVLALYFAAYYLFKKNRARFYDYLERRAQR
jgi:PTS system galactitol-specific IIC component